MNISKLIVTVMVLLTSNWATAQPVITQPPQPCTTAVGSTATFTVVATGVEPLTYQWQKYSVDLPGGTNATLAIPNVQTADGGPYAVVVTDANGGVAISDSVYLTVCRMPTITRQPTNFVSVSIGASVGNRVAATGGNLAYQWLLNDKPVTGQTKQILTLTNVQLADAGKYALVVTNVAGSVTSDAVSLCVDPTFTKITTGPLVATLDYWLTPNWFDYDSDGWLDLYCSTYNPNSTSANAVFHNNGDGSFTRVFCGDVTAPHSYYSLGAPAADFNNDGYVDLFVTHIDYADDLYRNDGGGRFTRLTKAAAGPLVSDLDSTADAAWADYDGDGFVDLFSGNVRSKNDNLYRNNGDAPFSKMTTNQVGMLVGKHTKSGPCAWVDYDNDGWPDLWLGNATIAPPWDKQFVWHNNGDGTFTPAFPGSIAADVPQGQNFVAWGDYDNDGYLDMAMGSFTTLLLHHNLKGVTFEDVAAAAGVADNIDICALSWGDYDNDGYLDLIALGYYANEASFLYHNNGDGTFTSIDVGSPIHDGDLRVGAIWADYDNDGFLDLLTQGEGFSPRPLFLYHNNGNPNGWLKVKLVGTASNRSAIGAKVRVTATIRGQSIKQAREISGNTVVSGGGGGLVSHFGLGDATIVDLVRIEWPSGLVQELKSVAPWQTLTITEHQEGAGGTPALTATRSLDGTVQLALTGQANLLYVFEGSSDLVNWAKLGVRTNLTGTVAFTDVFATNYARRFYRGVAP